MSEFTARLKFEAENSDHRGDARAIFAEARTEIKRLRAINAELVAALKEISLGRGPFKMDPMAHAKSIIETMKGVAKEAIAKAKP